MQERTSATVTHLAVSPRRTPTPRPEPVACTVRDVLDRVADKWTALAITLLAQGPMGYSAMRRSTEGISDKMLAQTLHRLERCGLVSRAVRPTRPIRVTYSLTPLGQSIVPPLAALREWAAEHGAEVLASQTAYDEGASEEA